MKPKLKKIICLLVSLILMVLTLLLILNKRYDGNNLIIGEVILHITILLFTIAIGYAGGLFPIEEPENSTNNNPSSIFAVIYGIILLAFVSLFMCVGVTGMHNYLSQYSYESFSAIFFLVFIEFMGVFIVSGIISGIKEKRKSRKKNHKKQI